jgi:hypothetical protein
MRRTIVDATHWDGEEDGGSQYREMVVVQGQEPFRADTERGIPYFEKPSANPTKL